MQSNAIDQKGYVVEEIAANDTVRTESAPRKMITQHVLISGEAG
jgi:hypothetical protein